MNKRTKIKVATVALMAPAALSSTLLINSCTVNDTVMEQLNKLKNESLGVLPNAQNKTVQAIINEVKVVEQTESGSIVKTYIDKAKLFKYIEEPIIERNVEMHIEDVVSQEDPNINNGNPFLSISYTLSKGGYKSPKNVIIASGKFRLQSEQDKIDVDKAFPIVSEMDCSISLKGSDVLPSEVNKANVWNYVNSELALVNSKNDLGVDVKISSIQSNNDQGYITISYIIYKNSYESSVVTTKPIFGFKKTSANNKEQVDNLINTNLNLVPSQQGEDTLPSKINLQNYKTYITGFIDSIDVETKVHSITGDDIQGSLTLSLSYKKGDQESIVKQFFVLGFKTEAENNDDLVNEEYSKIANIPWTIKDAGKNVLASAVDASNISTYVNNVPTPSNGVQVSYINFNVSASNSSNLTVIFQLTKGSSNSQIIQKQVTGFKSVETQDQNDVLEASKKYNLAPNENAKNIRPADVTLLNVSQYVSGLPPTTDAKSVLSAIVEVRPKELVPTNNEIVVSIKFSKNGATITKSWEVAGFKKMTEQEIFNNEVEKINPVISNQGKNVTAYYVNRNTVQQYITGWGEWLQYIDFDSMSYTPSENESQLTITFFVRKGKFSKQVTKVINGFMDEMTEASNNLVILLSEYQKIDWSGTINNVKKNEVLTTYFALGDYNQKLNRVKAYFSIPNLPESKTRGVNISLDVKYSKTDSNLSKTQLRLTWSLSNKYSEDQPVSIGKVFSDFQNPYNLVEKFVDVEQNVRKFGNYSDDSFSSISAASWQKYQHQYGWTNEWNDFMNGTDNWKNHEKWLRVEAFKYYFGNTEYARHKIVFTQVWDNQTHFWAQNNFGGFDSQENNISYGGYNNNKGAVSSIGYEFTSTIDGYAPEKFNITMWYEWKMGFWHGYDNAERLPNIATRMPIYIKQRND